MSACIVYIDGEHSKIFKLKESGVEEVVVRKAEIHHHSAADHDKAHKPTTHFFDNVIAALKGMNEILIIGPGVVKSQFRNHLDTHHHAEVAKKVVGVETVDTISDNRIVELGRKFFKNYDLFHLGA